jgi:hypothetical protein
MTAALLKICAWCHVDLATGITVSPAVYAQPGHSHGICQACLATVKAQLTLERSQAQAS